MRAGNLEAALAAVTATVKAEPTNADARWLMAEILLVMGNTERADRMLEAASLQEPNPAVIEFRQLLRAEVTRTQVVRDGRAPKYQGDDATPAQQAALRARMLLRTGDIRAASEAAEQVESLREPASGRRIDTQGVSTTFDDLRDADDLCAAEFEVLTTGGDHLLLPVSRVRSLSFDVPRRTRDLVWRRCTIDLKDGTEGVVFMPSLYIGAAAETEPALLLGRATEWTDVAAGPVRGRGQRMLLVGEELLPLNSLHRVEFD